MTPYHRCLASISVLLSVAATAPAHSRDDRQTDQTDLSAKGERLIVAPDANGFSIESREISASPRRNPVISPPATLGARHRIDRSIFRDAFAATKGKFDARR
jgi:hypothetical protein